MQLRQTVTKLLITVYLLLSLQGCAVVSKKTGEVNATVEKTAQAAAEKPVKKYPPYPEVWDYIGNPVEEAGLFYLASDGDVIIRNVGYSNENGHLVKMESIKGFFSGKYYPGISSKDLKAPDFVRLESNKFRSPFKLPNGGLVFSNNISTGAKCSDEFSDYIEIVSQDTNASKKYRFLYILEQPNHSNGSYCEGDVPREINVISMYPMFMLLPDDTFLAASGHIVIRFRSDFSTGSALLNERLFMIDYDINPYEEVNFDSKTELNKATDQSVWYQYLMQLKRSKQ